MAIVLGVDGGNSKTELVAASLDGDLVARVRKLLGPPDESARAGGQLCWDYGTPLSTGGMYAVCFRHGKVSYKSRG